MDAVTHMALRRHLAENISSRLARVVVAAKAPLPDSYACREAFVVFHHWRRAGGDAARRLQGNDFEIAISEAAYPHRAFY